MMRPHGRGSGRVRTLFYHARSRLGVLKRSVKGPNERIASMTRAGLLLREIVSWTGRLVSQTTYPRALFDAWGWGNLEIVLENFFKKPGAGKPSKEPGKVGLEDGSFEGDYPALAMYLTAVCWPDGEVRQPSSLVVFCEDGMFKACLSDKDSGYVLWSSAKTFADLPLAIEARLTDDHVDWRPGKSKRK